MIKIALPKGRLGDAAYGAMAKAGYGCSRYDDNSRKLVFESDNGLAEYFLVKPSDVAVYTEMGAADVGIAGKDVLNELLPDVYELSDTRFGQCKMCLAAANPWTDDGGRIKVATKFPETTKRYFARLGRDIEVIKLNGSIELAPLTGLSDVIVDLVETGTTLRENGLKVIEEIFPVSARLIANKSSYHFKREEIECFKQKLSEVMR